MGCPSSKKLMFPKDRKTYYNLIDYQHKKTHFYLENLKNIIEWNISYTVHMAK